MFAEIKSFIFAIMGINKINRTRGFITVLLLLTVLIKANSQPFCEIKSYSYEDGLSHSMITGFLQDKHGLLWISTWNGLSNYNGYSFKSFRPMPGDGCTMVNSRINRMQENSSGDIWCLNEEGKAYLFDVKTHRYIDALEPIQQKMHQALIVKDIIPLSNGVTWIICNDAICFRINEKIVSKKNGNSIINIYGSNDQKLKGDSVYTVFQDSEGDEWIFTNKGINIIGSKKIKSYYPFHFFTEYDNSMWLASADGRLARFDYSDQQLKFIKLPADIQNIFTVRNCKNNSLAIGTNAGIFLFNPKNLSFNQYHIAHLNNGSDEVQRLFIDNSGGLWIHGVNDCIIHFKGNLFEKIILPVGKNKKNDFSGLTIFEDKKSRIWFAPYGGYLYYYDRNSKRVNFALQSINGEISTVPVFIRTSFVDSNGNFWIGTQKGMNKITFFEKQYNLYNPTKKVSEVRAYLKDRYNRLWTATKDGVVYLNDPNGKFLGYLSRGGKITAGYSVFGSNVYDIYEDRDGNLWLGTKTDGLFILKSRDNMNYYVRQYQNEPTDNYSLSGNSVYKIISDSKKRIWIGCFDGGINLLEKSKNGEFRFINYKNRLKNFPAQYTVRVRHISEVKGVILVSTTNGLVSFSVDFNNPEEIDFFRNSRRPDDVNSLSGNDIMYTYTDSRGSTYVMTQNAGFSKIVSKNLLSEKINFEVFNERNGLPSDLTRSMIEDDRKMLWVVSRHFFSRFDPIKKTFESFGKYMFKQSFVFSEASLTFDYKRNLLIGTDEGTFSFDPEKMKKDGYNPPIIFTSIKVQGASITEDPDFINKLVLKPSQRNVTFQFAAIDYKGPEEIKYAYMLKGVDETWHEESDNRQAAYLNLPHGKYSFWIKSTNSDGVWSEKIRKLPIEVLPKFRETALGIILFIFVLILIVLIILYVMISIYRLRHEVSMEQHLSDIKLRFFTDVSHELRTPLTLIAGPVTEVLENEILSDKARKQLSLVQNNTKRLLLLVNQILDFRKIQNKKMKVLIEETNIIPIIQGIMLNFKSVAQEKTIELTLEHNVTPVFLWIDRDKFEKIFYNLLSNAFKYSLAGKVTLKVESDDDKVYLSVIDEGIGIPENKIESIFKRFEIMSDPEMHQPSSGLGLSLVKEMVELHHGNIEVKSEVGKGSIFKITFLHGRKHFENDKQAEMIISDIYETGKAEVNIENNCLEDEEETEDRQSILIVEDNEELLQFLKDVLSREYHVILAKNGKIGLEKTIETLPDLIVCDIMMPIMDGLEMIKEIKENKDICHIPIIVLSAKAAIEDRISGLEKGIDDYITKPFSASYLKTRIKTLLLQRKTLQDAFLASLTSYSYGEDDKPSKRYVNIMPDDPQITSYDEQLIKQIISFMEDNMDNVSLTIDTLASAVSMSRTVFYRKIKSLFGITPVDLIKDIRIKRAVQLIESGCYTFSEVAYMCGFSDPNYFGKCFKKQTGYSPSDYKKNAP